MPAVHENGWHGSLIAGDLFPGLDHRQEPSGAHRFDPVRKPATQTAVGGDDANRVASSVSADVRFDEIDDVIVSGVASSAGCLDDLEVAAGKAEGRPRHGGIEHDRDLVVVGSAPSGNLLSESCCGAFTIVPPPVRA